LEREHAGGERERSGDVLAELPAEDLAVVLELRQCDLRHVRAGERYGGERRADLLVPYLHHVLVARGSRFGLWPHPEELRPPPIELRVAVVGESVQDGLRAAERGVELARGLDIGHAAAGVDLVLV